MVRWQHQEVAAYAVSIFTGAFLLFQVQPLIGRYLLPWFGGAPGVWTTCMLFFQVLLLGGYAYAHLSSRCLRPRAQIVLHLCLVAAALCALPITPSDSWKPTDGSDPTLRIVLLLTFAVGLPYFVLSGTAPLLQHWFALSYPGVSPFRLYALSNTGSLLALLSYPALFEPSLTRRQQAFLWATGLAVYGLGCLAVSLDAWGKTADPDPSVSLRLDRQNAKKSPASDKVLWVAFPACASVLLLAVTNKVCQDVAVIPFLWVLPLSLYLLTFMICFERPSWYQRRWAVPALAVAIGTMTLLVGGTIGFSEPVQISLYAIGLFICCMVCHGETYRLKPDPAFLTSFYLLIAAGGALGGIFVVVIAPRVFADYFELHSGLLACGALLLLILARGVTRPSLRAAAKPKPVVPWRHLGLATGWILLATAGMLLWKDAHRFDKVRVARSRSFYGVLNVFEHDHQQPELSLREMMHGRVAHGMQFIRPPRSAWPTFYYSEGSGVGRAINLFPSGHRRIGVVGEGAGTLAAYGRKGDEFRFYEINPDVDRLARSHFSYLSNCAGKVSVALGDARLTLEAEPPQNFDVLVLDAFSSDAIPLHLLTREAFQLYERHLKTNGIIAVHTSNMSLNLEPVVVGLAKSIGQYPVVVEWREPNENWWVLASTWVLVSRDPNLQAVKSIHEACRPPLMPGGKTPLWTDDFAALFPVLRWNEFFGNPRGKATELCKTAIAMEEKGDLAGAIARYREALEHDPRFADGSNNLAWLLATAPVPSLRNGAEAVKLAEVACALTQYRQTIMVGTLGAAYAEAGRFDDAITTGERACRMAEAAGESNLLKFNQRLLGFYRAGQPFHDQREVGPSK
jgi:tetratricopeptide (TPR) repeat protein